MHRNLQTRISVHTLRKAISIFIILLLNLAILPKLSATQLSGTYTINASGTASTTVFKDFASAVIYMTSTSSRPDGGTANSGTVGVSGAVTFNVTAGTTYTLSSALTIPGVTGASSSNTITFKKNGSGANPIIYGYSGSGSADGIVIFQGASYITFDGIDVKDPSSNTSTTTQMEWGYALLRTSSPVGSQYITIQNCNIQLNRTNTNSVGIYGDCYSWSSGSLTAVTVSSSSGTNSFNQFYSNTISNCFTPIYLRGYQTGTASISDVNNDIGSAGGNIISAFGYLGNSAPYSNPYTGAVVNGIFLYQQGGTYLIENNTITLTASDNISTIINGISSVAWGVAVTGSNPTIIGNTVNITSTATSSSFTGIANNQGTGNSIEDVENNVVTGINTTATGAVNFIGINIQSTIGSGKYIYNGNEIKNCVLYGTGYFYGISTTGGGTPASPMSFSNNKIHDNSKSNGNTGDMYLIHCPNGKISLTIANNQIYNNSNATGSLYGIYNTTTTSTEDIRNNIMYNLSISTSNSVAGIFSNNSCTTRNIYLDSFANFTSNGGLVYGINCSAGTTVNIYRNKIYFSSGAFAGIYYNGINGTSSAPGIISNNFIILGGSGGFAYGIFDNGGSYHSYYNNSILITNNNASNAGIILIGNASNSYINLNNNSAVNTGGGYAIDILSGSGINSMDNNNWYTSGSYIGYWGGTYCAKLSDFQKAGSVDYHSLSINPPYYSTTDLHLKNKTLFRLGTTHSAVTNDIDGKPRYIPPTIGAVEVPPIRTDLGISAIVGPVYGNCGDSFTTISANVTNYGIDSQTNILVTAVVKGQNGFKTTYTTTYKPKLLYDSTVLVNITSSFNTSQGGTYTFKIYTSLKNDSNHTNDTAISMATFYSHSPKPTVTFAAICGRGSMKLSASITTKGDSIYWYSYPLGDTLLGSGTTFITPAISKTTSYYAQEKQPVKSYNIGPKTNGIGTTNTTGTEIGVKLNALTTINIDSATIYPVSSGGVIVVLYDSLGNYLKSANAIVVISSPGTAVRIPIGIIVSPGNGYLLKIYNATNGLYYNTSGAIYPYSISNVASIVSPSNSTGSSTNYYCLYNLLIRTSNCGSQLIPVTATIATPSATLTNDFSSAGKYFSGNASKPDQICAGNSFVYDLVTGLGNGNYGTTWTVASKSVKTLKGTISNDTSFSLPSLSKGAGKFTFNTKAANADSIYVLKITVRTLGKLSCDSTIVRYISVSPLPKQKLGFKNACLGNPLSYYDSSTISTGSISGRIWDFGDTKTSSLQNPTHSYAAAGQYPVTLVTISDLGCLSTTKKTVEQYLLPKAKFGIVPACQGYPTSFTDSSSISSGSITSRLWNFGDGSTSTATNPTHIYQKSGGYHIKLLVQSVYGCKDSTIKTITKIQPKPVASFDYNNNTCTGSIIYFGNKSTDSSVGTTYKWEYGDGSVSTGASGAHTYSKNGSYRMKLTVTTKAGCVDTTVQTITPNPKPSVNFFYPAACTAKTITFSDSGKNDKTSLYTWAYGDGGNDQWKGIITTTHKFAKAGTYATKLVITSPAGCADSETRSIIVTDNPKAGFTVPDVCFGKTSQFSDATSPSTTTYSYKWDFGDGSSLNTTQNPAHTFKASGVFKTRLTVLNSSGCSDTITKPVNVNNVPNVGKWTAHIHNYTVKFVPSDSSQKTYKWIFGDGDSSSSKSPLYVYPNKVAQYQVKLFVTNSSGCTGSFYDSVSLGKTGIENNSDPENIVNVFPNPFESKTNISYTLANPGHVIISIYDLRGRLLSNLKDGMMEAGQHQEIFDAGAIGNTEGIYLLRMMINESVYTFRMVNLK